MANTTSLKLPDELKDRVSELAKGVAQTPHAYMVGAIAEKVARDERRRAFLEDARRSAKEVEKTGIAYAHKDVMQYFLAKATGRKARKPRPMNLKRGR